MRGVRLSHIPIRHLGEHLEEAQRAYRRALERAGQELKQDFEKTTRTWSTNVRFEVRVHSRGVTVTTRNAIWRYVDAGTRPHIIRPRRARILAFRAGYTPKTRVGSIIAGAGGPTGPRVVARQVQHPGTKARGFSRRLRAKWKTRWPEMVKRAIAEALA